MENPKIGFRLTQAERDALYAASGGDVAAWVRQQLRAAQDPVGRPAGPTDLAAARRAAFDRGWELGTTFERLGWFFERGLETELDVDKVALWASHPDNAADWALIQTRCALMPWADRFAAWWAARVPPV